MPDGPRCTVLLVRSIADLPRACDELAAYLLVLQRRSPGNARAPVQLIWIDEEGTANLPSELVLSGESGPRRTVRILESAGINGIWMLCWLEAAASTVTRPDLVAALMECFGHEGTDPAALAARFIPVIKDNPSSFGSRAELHALEAHYPGLALSPIYQDNNGSFRFPHTTEDNPGQLP